MTRRRKNTPRAVVLELAAARQDPFLSEMFRAAERGGSVITDIRADNEEALRQGRVTVTARGL